MHIGPYALPNNLFVAPMAGVTDRPFRMLCKSLGAGYAVSEMVTSRRDLWNSLKTSRRADHAGEGAPIAVQIAGTDAAMMAEAAAYNIERGAQIIDINMGCPAKKVCNKWAGSALMQDEPLAVEIAAAVVAACAPHGVPVTLKMRTGWCDARRNAVALSRRFEAVGVQMLTVHGRTREQGYQGQAEYDTIAQVKAAVRIPVVANGDIDSPEKARVVLAATGADAVMVGRAAQGRPWIFREIAHYLATGEHLAPPLVAEVRRLLLDHLEQHYTLYGAATGVRSARKHIGWYVRTLPGGEDFRRHMNALEDCASQSQAVAAFFDALAGCMDRMPVAAAESDCHPEQQGMP
ncbi:MAG TPA: tRNA dihydrouridine synthase DusB, partial [Burkholderiaceae bacterium]